MARFIKLPCTPDGRCIVSGQAALKTQWSQSGGQGRGGGGVRTGKGDYF